MMAKSSYEKAIDKQRRANKKIAEQEMRRQRAVAIVNGQRLVGGLRILDSASEEILKIILEQYDGNENRYVESNCDVFPKAYHSSLSLEFEKLSMYGIVSSPQVWIDGYWEVTLTPQGITYFEDKLKAEEKEKITQRASINIGNIVANGSNLILGDVINSSLSIDNSINRIETEIEQKGGEDTEELHEIFEEVKEIIENIQSSRYIPKNKRFFSKLSNHLEKHGWFYGEIIGLLGTTALQMLNS